ADEKTVRPFGTLITTDVVQAMDIPFYPGRVIEGGDIGFRYRGRAALRTAQILPDPEVEVRWLERHLHLTQLFVTLGAPFVMVLTPPNHENDAKLPDLDAARALRFPANSAFLLHLGTWHDFPIALDRPVTTLIANSAEVVEALRTAEGPRELDSGDVLKVSLSDRFGVTLRPLLR
ncbi:ureidoglycolate lyase, partial [Streptomyces daliensis]|nr:ureidoglycolate lyase [Streptomyces daliensis]